MGSTRIHFSDKKFSRLQVRSWLIFRQKSEPFLDQTLIVGSKMGHLLQYEAVISLAFI